MSRGTRASSTWASGPLTPIDRAPSSGEFSKLMADVNRHTGRPCHRGCATHTPGSLLRKLLAALR
jgi:hypothetical protein